MAAGAPPTRRSRTDGSRNTSRSQTRRPEKTQEDVSLRVVRSALCAGKKHGRYLAALTAPPADSRFAATLARLRVT